MSDEEQNEGKVDGLSVAYILGGIPVIVLFLVILFAGARSCNWPA